jgi:hypothetical protein
VPASGEVAAPIDAFSAFAVVEDSRTSRSPRADTLGECHAKSKRSLTTFGVVEPGLSPSE